MGRPTEVTDAMGVRTLVYDHTGDRRLLHEQLPAGYGASGYGARRVTHRYNAQRRWNGYQLGSSASPYRDADVTYSWSASNGRLTSVTGMFDTAMGGSTSGTSRTWTYAYTGGSRLPWQVSTGSGSSAYKVQTIRPHLRPELVSAAANEFGSTNLATYGYEFDRRGRLVEAGQAGTMFENLYGVQGLRENRLVGVTRSGHYWIRHKYDWQGRLARTELYLNNPAGSQYEKRTFDSVYVGRMLISQVITGAAVGFDEEEEEGPDPFPPIQELYLWGLDRSGTLEGAGTVGGLLSTTRGWTTSTEHSFIAQDGLGNVVAYINPANGARRAEFEYGPFGETVRTTAVVDADTDDLLHTYRFAHRWQNRLSSAFYTTLALPQSEYYDFGARWYEPSLGRFLSPGPGGLTAGGNAYAFAGGNPFSSRFMQRLADSLPEASRLPSRLNGMDRWLPKAPVPRKEMARRDHDERNREGSTYDQPYDFMDDDGYDDDGLDFWDDFDEDPNDPVDECGGDAEEEEGDGDGDGLCGDTDGQQSGQSLSSTLRKIPLIGRLLAGLVNLVSGATELVAWSVTFGHVGSLQSGLRTMTGGVREVGAVVLDVAGKIWAAPVTAVGIAWGLAGVPFGAKPEFGHNAILFLNHPFIKLTAMTIGNTTHYPKGYGPESYDDGYGRLTHTGLHEEAHTWQTQLFGIFFPLFYLPRGWDGVNNPIEQAADDYALGGGWLELPKRAPIFGSGRP